MAIKFTNRPAPAATPVVADQPYTIFTALNEWVDRTNGGGGTLMIVHNETGVGYRVMAYDKTTQQVRLKGPQGEYLHPKVTEREAKIYHPVWRE